MIGVNTMSNAICPRYKYFALVIYPDFDNNHNQLFKYLNSNDSYCRSIWICHDKDHYTDDVLDDEGNVIHFKGDPEKIHYHILIKTTTQKTVSSVLSFFSPWVKHIEPVSDHVAYALYMYHNTPQAIADNKYQYSLDDIQGDNEWKGQLLQNGYFVQLGFIFTLINQDVSLTDIYEWCMDHRCKDVFDSHQYLITSMVRDRLDRVKFETYNRMNLIKEKQK